MSGSPTVDEKTVRVRDLLSSYYGLPAAPKPPSSSGSTPANAPVRQPRSTSLEATGFDEERYMNQLLRSTRLSGLLQTQADLSTDIRSLDSDMQRLVYDNYNKFISATDTIRLMKTSLDSMDGKVHKLRETIGSVAERNASVNSKLQLRRDQMDEFGNVRELLVRLQAVFELPKRLRTAVEQGAVELAVEKYAEAAELLRQYGHKGAFRQVNAEVQACVKDLSTTLKQRLVAEKGQAVETIQLIRKLGEPVENLQDNYLDCMRQRLRKILSDAEELSSSSAADGTQEPREVWGYKGWESLSLSKLVVEVDQRFISELAAVAVAFTELFGPSGRGKLIQMAREMFTRYCSLLKSCLQRASATEASRAAKHLNTHNSDKADDWGTAQLAQALSTFATDVSRLQSSLPEISPQDRGVEVVEGIVRHHIGECFLQLEQRVFRDLSAVGSKLQEPEPAKDSYVAEAKLHERNTARKYSAPAGTAEAQHLLEAYGRVSSLINSGTLAILRAMSGYEQQSGLLKSWKDVFVDLVQGQVQHLLLSLLAGKTLLEAILELLDCLTDRQASLEAAGELTSLSNLLSTGFLRISGLQPEGSEVSAGADSYQREAADAASLSGTCLPGVLLLLARLTHHLEAATLVQIMETLAALFPGQGAAAGGDQPPAFVAGEVARRFSVGATSLLEVYVQAEGARLSLALRRGLESRMREEREPRAPRPEFSLLLERLALAETHISVLLEEGRSADTSYERSQEEEGTASSSALERNVARLFRQKTPMFAALAFTQSSILGGILRFALKAFVECIRLQTLTRTGLQQLQLDLQFLRQKLTRFSKGPNLAAMHGFLDEALTSALDRSLETTLLDAPVLERILASSLTG